MAYDATKPADDGYLAAFPPEMREQLRAIIQDAIVNSGLLNGLNSGNANGNIPVSNGVENTNLNAAMLSGKTAADFAPKAHGHDAATSSSDGFETAAEHNKLAGIAEGAEVNQNAFSNILVGGTTIQADNKTDTLEIVSGTNITVTPDAVNDKVTIAVSGKVGSATQADNAGNSDTVDGYHAIDLIRSDGGVLTQAATINPVASGWSGFNFIDGGRFINLITPSMASSSSLLWDIEDTTNWNHYWELRANGDMYIRGNSVIHSGNIGNQSVNKATITHRLYRHDPESEDTYYISPYWTSDSRGWRIGAYNTASDEQANIHRVSVDYADSVPWSGVIGAPTIGNQVFVLTGTVAHGGTIPLPSGYTQAQCQWMVSTNSNGAIYTNGSASGVSTFQNIYCSANANRVVTCYINCQNYGNVAGTANYIIIGVK